MHQAKCLKKKEHLKNVNGNQEDCKTANPDCIYHLEMYKSKQSDEIFCST